MSVNTHKHEYILHLFTHSSIIRAFISALLLDDDIALLYEFDLFKANCRNTELFSRHFCGYFLEITACLHALVLYLVHQAALFLAHIATQSRYTVYVCVGEWWWIGALVNLNCLKSLLTCISAPSCYTYRRFVDIYTCLHIDKSRNPLTTDTDCI